MSRTARILDGLVEGGVIAVLLLSPLPFGSILPWAQAGIESVVAVLGSLLLMRMLATGEITVPLTPLLWPGLAMAGVVGLQLLRPAGSVSPFASWESARLYIAYLGFLVVLAAHLVTRARIIRLVSILIGWGVVLAVLGLVNQMLGHARILWFQKEAYLDRLTSTFVNPNHQALYFSVPLFMALGVMLQPRRRRGLTGDLATAPVTAWRIGLPGRILLAGGMIVMGVALLLTGSRGGVISALVGLVVVLGLSLHGRVSGRIPVALGAAVALFGVYASSFGLELVVGRFAVLANEPFGDMRWSIWDATLQVIRDAPVLGVGLGAYADAFRLHHHPPTIWSALLVEHAHNDYLQLFAEVGLLGVLVLLWALVALAAFVLPRWIARHDLFVRGLTLGGIGALSAVAAHSVTDFGLHMPANALLVIAVCALLPAGVTLRLHRAGYRVDLREWRLPLTSFPRTAGAVAALAVCVLAAAAPIPPAFASWYVREAAQIASATGERQGTVTLGDLARAQQELRLAVRLDARNPGVQAALAGVTEELARRVWAGGVTVDGRRLPSASPTDRLRTSQELLATAYDAYQQSLHYRPRAARTHDRFAWFLGAMETLRRTAKGSLPKGSIVPGLSELLESEESLLPRALEHLRQGVRWDPNNAYRHRSLALFALTYLSDTPAGLDLVVQGFREALSLDRSLLGEVVDRLSSRSPGLLRAAVPSRSPILVDLARQLEQRGRSAAAMATFEEAVSVATEPEQQAEARLAYGQALLQKRDPQGALFQARQALVSAPKNPEVFSTLAEIYEATQQWSEAESALTSAFALARAGDPGRVNVYRARLANFLRRRGQPVRALLLRRENLQHAQSDPWAHFEVATLLEELREGAAAFQEYKAAEALGHSTPGVYREVARAYLRNGQFKEAVVAYEAAVRLAPREGELRVELAEVYSRAGRREQAIEQYRRVLSFQPNHSTARQALTSLGVEPVATTIR